MKTFYLNFDTKNSTTGIPFDCHIKCDQPINGSLNRIYLRSFECPIGWYNVRSPYNTFTIYQSTTAYTVTISEGNYIISTLLSAIGTALSLATDKTYSLSSDSVTNKVTISNTNSQAFSIYTNTASFDLGAMLGFTNGQTSSSASITSSNSYNLNYDTYVNLVFDNLPTSFLNQNPTTFKIGITEGHGSLLYFFHYNTFTQFIDCKDSNIQLYYLKLRVLDRYGNIISNNGLNFSFTLEFNMN